MCSQTRERKERVFALLELCLVFIFESVKKLTKRSLGKEPSDNIVAFKLADPFPKHSRIEIFG